VNEFNSSPVYSGSNSISVTAGPYTALSLYHPDFSTTPYASLSFWINGGAAGASGIQVMGVTNHGDLQYYSAIYSLPALASNTWTQFNLPLSALGVADITNCQGFWFWPTLTGTTKFYVDSIQLNLAAATAKSNIAAIVASLPASPNPDAPSLAIVPGTPPVSGVVLLLGGKTGATYRLEASTDLRHWTPLSTNRLQTSTMTITNPVNPAWHCQYWRAVGP